ncbi:GNAT family N-acetyltransferase [Bacillus sp. NPDC077411]|uniref:GNAT family N-acetyltransferase n=1 Tax=Bacillus bruguierae TaxID=3127667 RepID=A0ABU8FIX9_9BACI|nr:MULTISPECIES: GNAT family N-acetyltransferase [unclassified Bacillus (in: firmicutes)]SFJ51200.1 Ribosomal protein S18 acetylase RimI [Bacillus sp. 71mf]SFT04898.1 Ribosomal protein S18 acetylase RimI [Bacillus sp. 103mf]
MNIRVANNLDYPALRLIYLESRRKSFHWADIEEMTLEDFDKDTVGEFIILAEENNRILGFASLYLPENFIHNLFVHPNFFGKGVGGALIHASIEKMNKPLRLKCVSKNEKAMKFYENKGWKKVVEEGETGERYWVMVFE